MTDTNPIGHLDGRIANIRYRSEDGQFTVSQLHTDDGRTVTVAGPDANPTVRIGLAYRLHGKWEHHPQHGQQWRYHHASLLTHDKRGVVAYLAATAPNVGEKRAVQLWDAFGADAVNVLRERPSEVVARGILNEGQAAEASQALHDAGAWQGVRIDLLGLLDSRGFQLGRVLPECIRRWRRNAPAVVRRNPYALLLAQIPSCGWVRVDRLYLDLGGDPATLKRQALTLTHYLLDRRGGDTWVPAADVANDLRGKISTANPKDAMRLAERARLVRIRRASEGRWLAPRKWADDEATIASRVKEIMAWMPDAIPANSHPSASTPANSSSPPPIGTTEPATQETS